jgi:hypothetical protein
MPRVVKRSASQAAKSGPPRRSAALPLFVTPQLSQPVEKPPCGPQWLHEIKLDGYRMAARIDNGRVQLLTRTGLDWTDKYPSAIATLANLNVKTAYLDGELCGVDEDGLPTFAHTQAATEGERDVQLVYYAFDLLHLDGRDISNLQLIERKGLLEPLLANKPGLQFNGHETGDGELILKHAGKLGFEGVVSKTIDAPYAPGNRGLWRKAKWLNRQEFVIVGWSDPEGQGRTSGRCCWATTQMTALVTHPCHPPIFNDETEPKAKTDYFGGVHAKQHIVCALMQGPDSHYAECEAIAREIYKPVMRAHRCTVEQLAILEPALSETVGATFALALREAADEAVRRGVPKQAAIDFIIGHLNIELAIAFGIFPEGKFSDAALQAIDAAKPVIFRWVARPRFCPRGCAQVGHRHLRGRGPLASQPAASQHPFAVSLHDMIRPPSTLMVCPVM